MATTNKTYEELLSENQELQWQLDEANETIDAIRTGQVDALVVQGENGSQLFTLKTADQTYRVLIEKMNEGAVTISPSGLILYSNSRFAAMVNLPLEKVIGLSFDIFIPDDYADRYKTLIKQGWETDCKAELFIRNKFGKQTCCLLSCNTLELDEGVSMSIIITDLTSQKEIQQRLKTQNKQLEQAQNLSKKLNDQLEATVEERTKDLSISREHFKLLADNVPQMTWTNLPNGDMNFFNERWYQYTGLSFGEIEDWGWKALLHPDDVENTINRYIASLQSGQIFEIENRYKRGRDGTYRWHLNRSVPLKNETGKIIFWVGTATDIDDQKKEMERKDEFIGVASHELKTPLTSLKGYLQLMALHASTELTPKASNYVSKANNALGKLQRLVDDLLDVSKIQAGQLNYTMERVDVAAIVHECYENAVHMYPEHEIEVEDGEQYFINGNAERLEQVLMNLLNNAVKYSKTNKKIIIKTAKHENWVRISVTDFGIGLTEEQKHLIFDRFYRVEDKRYTTSGLGMGLYISSQIINTHNGRIDVESEFGKGATFYFDLPLAEEN